MPRVVFVQGGGVGYDQEQALRRLLVAAEADVHLETHYAGRAALERGLPPLPEETIEAVRANGLALKTKLLPPPPHVTPSPEEALPLRHSALSGNYNVAFRRALGLFASVRLIRNLPGIPARFDHVDILLVREITEDLYATAEHEIIPGVVQSFKIVTAAACRRFFRFTFELARQRGRRTVHCIHKANILKLADGLFLDCFREIALEYPDLVSRDLIVDNTCMQLVSRPSRFDVLAVGNLYGDLLSDLGAGLIGGISGTAAINFGPDLRVYEAVYGAGYESVPPDTANPLPLLMPALEMLQDVGQAAVAERLRRAIVGVLKEGTVRTQDLGGSASTTQFTDAILDKLS
ncbi:isocitrate/isopropylmalate family dehydrogenase [Thermogemmata fonticola]|uniref:Isocitrate dehydrogenase n=1 Tax=Thermogemmata fonticola TaxID=2755323 RepID=A0A7V8VB86_9BACT|nr:isocitrate/isopropylmalate family dehydrogenase [Thermogemmata fonticola]MBA2224848.1 isocitrate dehydrogenase [Thermogemmata fonticola]